MNSCTLKVLFLHCLFTGPQSFVPFGILWLLNLFVLFQNRQADVTLLLMTAWFRGVQALSLVCFLTQFADDLGASGISGKS